jgi:hypothetical protein
MKQTAVEWLVEQYLKRKGFLKTSDIEQAKEMEKQQTVNFGYDIADDLACGVLSKKAIEDRYNETYKKEE